MVEILISLTTAPISPRSVSKIVPRQGSTDACVSRARGAPLATTIECCVRFKSSSRKFNAGQNWTETTTTNSTTMMRVLLLLCFSFAAIEAKIVEPRPFKRLIPADTLRGKVYCALWGVHSVVIFCRVFLTCSMGRCADTATTVQPRYKGYEGWLTRFVRSAAHAGNASGGDSLADSPLRWLSKVF